MLRKIRKYAAYLFGFFAVVSLLDGKAEGIVAAIVWGAVTYWTYPKGKAEENTNEISTSKTL